MSTTADRTLSWGWAVAKRLAPRRLREPTAGTDQSPWQPEEQMLSFNRFWSFAAILPITALVVLLCCGGETAECTTSTSCSTGYQCIGGECGLPPTTACPASETSCSGACTDTT